MTNLWKTTAEKWTSTRFSTENVEKSAINIRQLKVFHHLWKKNSGKLPCGKLKLRKSGKRCADRLPAVETLWIKKHDK